MFLRPALSRGVTGRDRSQPPPSEENVMTEVEKLLAIEEIKLDGEHCM